MASLKKSKSVREDESTNSESEQQRESDVSRSTANQEIPETLALVHSFLGVPKRGRAAKLRVNWLDSSSGTYKLTPDRLIPAAILQRRRIRNYEICHLNSTLIRSRLGELFKLVPNMQSLKFTGCYELTDAILLDTFPPAGLPCLTYLSVRNCAMLTDTVVDLITLLMPNLVTLDLGFCPLISDYSLLFITVRLHKLNNLDLTDCGKLTKKGIGYLAGQVNLDEAAICDLPMSRTLLETNNNVGDLVGNKQVDKVSSITDLNLHGCHKVTDDTLRHLSSMTELRCLDLSFCKKVGDTGLSHLTKLANLQELKLVMCRKVHNDGLAHLAKMPSLKVLSLRGCLRISNTGLTFLSPNSGITWLDVSGCRALSSRALSIIAAEMFNLKFLQMDFDQFTTSGLKLAKRNLCHLDVLHVIDESGESTRCDIRGGNLTDISDADDEDDESVPCGSPRN